MDAKLLLLFLGSFLLCSGLSPVEARRVATLSIGQGEATVSFLTGPAEVLEKGKWSLLRIKDTLGEGDHVRTGTGALMELLLPDESRVRFAGDSEFMVNRLAGGDPSIPRDVKVHVALGKAWSNITQALGAKGNFEITCDKAITGVRGTIYRLNVDADHSVLVRVYDGKVAVSGGGEPPASKQPIGPPTRIAGPKPIPGPHKVTRDEWTVIIKSMQQVRIGADGMPEKPREFTEAEDRDEWVDWNRGRDREGR